MRRDLYDTRLVALFLDATFISDQPSGPGGGAGRVGISAKTASWCCWQVMLGMRESYEDWQALGRDLGAGGWGRRC